MGGFVDYLLKYRWLKINILGVT